MDSGRYYLMPAIPTMTALYIYIYIYRMPTDRESRLHYVNLKKK